MKNIKGIAENYYGAWSVIIPTPSKKDIKEALKRCSSEISLHGNYVLDSYRPAKTGEVVFSVVLNEIVRKNHNTKSSYWILKPESK